MPADEPGSGAAGGGPPEPPTQPALEDCCNSGCERCVFDVYYEALERYREALRVWQSQHSESAKSIGDSAPDRDR